MKGAPLAAKALVRSLILLALVAAAGFVAVKLRMQSPAAPTSGAPETGRAALFFPKTTVETVTAPDANRIVIEFPFENRSDQEVTIAEVEKNCDCVEMGVTDGKLAYAPGEHGAIRARFELGNLSGIVEKPFKLWLVGDPEAQPSHTLTPRMIIPELVAASEKTLKWETGEGAMPRMSEITILHDQPIRALGVTSSLDSFRVQLKTIEEGRRYQVWVTPTEPLSPRLAIIRVTTDSSIPRWKALNLFALIQNPPEQAPATASP